MKIVVALAAFAVAVTANAAGLGRLTVFSGLGQPLIAEIEIVAVQPGEEDGLSARLASADAFAAAGIEISPALNGLRISLERRDKRPYLRLTTMQPVNEPFLDVLVELSWNAGKLVREYTFLLDPPEYRGAEQPIPRAPAPAPETPAAAAPQPQPEPPPQVEAEAKPAAEPAPVPGAAAAPEAEKPAATAEPEKPVAAAEPEKPVAPVQAQKPEGPAGTTYQVKRGDTLGAIAKEHLRPGLTLNQMLIGIFRANEDAFIRGNINLVRTGRILNIPDSDSISTLDRNEVNRIVREHHAQFSEYRARIAAVPTRTEAGQQGREVAGPIEAKPEPPKPPAPADQLRLSKAAPGKPGAAASQAAREDDAAARERELQEAQARIAELERNVADQQKLLAMRNQQLAELERKGTPKPAAEAPKPAPAAPKPAAPAPAKPAAEAPKPAAEAPKPAAEAPKPAAEAPKPAAPAPKAAAKAPPPEPSLIDEFLADPIYMAALAGIVLVLVIFGWWRWRRKRQAQAKFEDSVLGAAAGASGGGMLGGEPTAPASNASVMTQTPTTASASAEAEEVDPIAEADVYMAYGRDAQAEEILKEALQKDATRIPVHGKLLEIYAHRKDARAFEQTALKLKNLTNGTGPEWEKAAALGRTIDPANSSYAGAASAAEPSPVAPAAAAPAPVLDFDLGGAGQTQAAVPDISLDAGDKDSSGGLDFDLDLGAEEQKPEPAKAAPPKPAPEPSGGLEFDLKLDLDKPAESNAAAPSKVDLSSISLDLGTPDTTVMGGKASSDPKWQEVATKLDLAKAYEEMGDKDGARELLNEVVKDGDAAQRGSAEQLLARLG